VYDPATDSWTRIADSPVSLTHCGVAVVGREIYFAGGVVGTDTEEKVNAVTNVWKYNVDTDSWSEATPLPEPRGAGALVLLERKLHFFGGTGLDRHQAEVDHWVLSLDADDGWTNAAPLPAPRNHLGGAALGGKVYAIAGQTGHNETATMFADVYAWDPATDAWSAVAPLPSVRSHITGATLVHDSRIIVLGGEIEHGGDNSVADVETYDPVTNAWTPLTPLPEPRHSGVAGVLGEDIFYTSGSTDAPGRMTTTFRGEFQVSGGTDSAFTQPDILDAAPGDHPRVGASSPDDGATGVRRDAAIILDLLLANEGQGLDESTLSTSNVQLLRAKDNALVRGTVNTTAADDTIVYQPVDLLDADTTYTFRLTEGVTDRSGTSIVPFSLSFATGSGPSELNPPATFQKTKVYSGDAISSVVVSPDGAKLYAAFLDGRLRRWTIGAEGRLEDEETISGLVGRAIIGLCFDPSDSSVLWVSHNAPLEPQPAPDYSGIVSRLILRGPGFEATIEDYVIGLPRSARDHMTNSLVFGPDGMLYVAQGSNTAAGAPTDAWGNRPERLLSASVLRIDPRRTTRLPIDVRTEDTRLPFIRVSDAPVTIFAAGTRNAYDLVWHSNGYLYVPTNGAGYGDTPASPPGVAPAVPGLKEVAPQNDYLNVVGAEGGGYFGHPNPLRGQYALNGANPTGDVDPAEVVDEVIDGEITHPGYPVGVMADKDYRRFAWDFGPHRSPNGIIEYQSATFGGALQGKLLVVEYSAGDDIVALTPGADGNISNSEVVRIIDGLKNPLDLAEDVSNGNIYVVEIVRGRTKGVISVLHPACEGVRCHA
jgi:N-acetylneuraminic acid mutarotase